MRNTPSFSWRRLCRIALCLMVFFLFCSSSLAAGAFRVPFSYYADSQELSTVLTSFARTEGYNASFTAHVKGKVSGRFNNIAPEKFLKGMQDAFDVNWYVMGRTIYFYNTAESQRIFLTPRTGNVSQLYDTLKQSGVFSPQLPARISGTGDVISVSGPPEYLNQIRSAVSAFEASQMDQIVMRVFPLKYAWADDQTVTSMDKTVTIPGVAAILRAMVLGGKLHCDPRRSAEGHRGKAGRKGTCRTWAGLCSRQHPGKPFRRKLYQHYGRSSCELRHR